MKVSQQNSTFEDDMILKAYWTVLIIVFIGLTVYFNISTLLVVDEEKDFKPPVKSRALPVKKIMAYSLKKQIELDGKEFVCEKKFSKNSAISSNEATFWSKVVDMEVYVTSVTLDQRLEPYSYLRIVGVIKGSWNATLYCQILSKDDHVRIIKSTVTPIWYEKWDMNDNNTYYNPVLISCRLPEFKNSSQPTAVALSEKPCQFSSKYLELTEPEVTNKLNFTLCVKPLNFAHDISRHLVEWIEMSRTLGAQFFHIFVQNVTENTRRLLKWYKNRYPNMINLEDFTPVDSCDSCRTNYLQSTWQRRKYEVVTYNKCFYSNLNSQFIVPLDVDEIIVPKSVRTWQDLVQKRGNYSSLIIQNVYFFARSKNRFNRPFFLNENRRNKVPNQKGENGKSFISTKNSLTVFNHYALQLLRPGVIKDYYFMQFTDAQLNHYKASCNLEIFPECAKYLSSPTIIDDVIARYKNEFYQQYHKVLNRIKDDGINVS